MVWGKAPTSLKISSSNRFVRSRSSRSVIDQSHLANCKLAVRLAEILLRLQCRSATHARSRNGLSVNAIGDIAGDEKAGNFCFDPGFRKQITLRIHIELASIRLCVGIMPDRDENARHFQVAFLV